MAQNSSTVTVEGMTGAEIEIAREADVRTYSADALKFRPKRERDAAVKRADGKFDVTLRDAQPRGVRVYGTVNGRAESSVVLPRSVLLARIKEHAGDDKALAGALVARYPFSGEPPAPPRALVAQVASQRDALLASIIAHPVLAFSRAARKTAKSGTVL